MLYQLNVSGNYLSNIENNVNCCKKISDPSKIQKECDKANVSQACSVLLGGSPLCILLSSCHPYHLLSCSEKKLDIQNNVLAMLRHLVENVKSGHEKMKSRRNSLLDLFVSN